MKNPQIVFRSPLLAECYIVPYVWSSMCSEGSVQRCHVTMSNLLYDLIRMDHYVISFQSKERSLFLTVLGWFPVDPGLREKTVSSSSGHGTCGAGRMMEDSKTFRCSPGKGLVQI